MIQDSQQTDGTQTKAPGNTPGEQKRSIPLNRPYSGPVTSFEN